MPVLELQRYLDCLRAQFFPMIQFPNRANEFILPSITNLKSLLYNNDIGYKTVDEKCYVRRYYRLPALLFPLETVATSVLLDKEKVE